jgi:DnaK suppressor protein
MTDTHNPHHRTEKSNPDRDGRSGPDHNRRRDPGRDERSDPDHDANSDPAIDIPYFRSRLIAMREEIDELEQARSESQATVELDQTRVGRLSRMDAMQQQAMAQATGERARTHLLRIESALKRCDDGSYGDCLRCETPIDPRRLEVDPAATLCIQCAEQPAD